MFGWCKPRDPARIEKVLDALKVLWLTQPDQRLGQLLENYVFTQGPRDKTTVFLFYQEDDLTLNNIKKKIAETKKQGKDKLPEP